MGGTDRREKYRVGSDLSSLENGGELVHTINYSNDENNEKKQQSKAFWTVPLLVILWYCSACLAITSSKKIMNQIPLPFLLCTIQFLVASLVVGFYSKIILGTFKTIPPSSRYLIYQISLSYTFGFIFTNTAFSLVSASFAETVKSAEPLSSVFLNYFYFKEASTTQTYLTLLPICMGVSISCMHDGTFGIIGFLCAFTSNFCFSSRAVLTKHLFRIRKEVASINEVCLFTHISNIGLLVLIPMTIMMEGSSIIKLFSSNLDINSWNLLLNFSVNGVAYSVYNLMSFLVLSRTDLVTHAVLNVFRRVFIIIFTSYYFVQYLSALNIFGIFLAVVGVVLFCFSRSKGSSTTNTMTEK